MDNRKKKAKIYRIATLICIAAMLVEVICIVVLGSMGWYTQGGGIIIPMLFVPIFVLLCALAILFRSKSKEVLEPPINLTASEKRRKRFLTIIVMIPTVIATIGLLFLIISEIIYSLTH